VPSLLGVVAPETALPARTIAVARSLGHYVVENAKPARAFLKTLAPDSPLRELRIVELGESPSPARCAELLAPARSGHDVGLLSDAGCPGIADPGALLVAQAHVEAIAVVPLVGPSAVLLALMASGMNGQAFVFHGYLPVDAGKRAQAITRIEADSVRSGYAQLFIETPYRNVTMLGALLATVQTGDTALRCGRSHDGERIGGVATGPRLERHRARPLRKAAGDLRAAGLGRRVLDVALQHLVLEALLLEHCLRDVVKGHDTEQASCRPSPERSGRAARASLAAARSRRSTAQR
jgi:16S rRNA (cytidine1402-2'-O)-methyltransferase